MARARITRSPAQDSFEVTVQRTDAGERLRALGRTTWFSDQLAQDLLGAQRNHRSGTEHARHTRVVKHLVVLRRNHSADKHQNVSAAEFAAVRR